MKGTVARWLRCSVTGTEGHWCWRWGVRFVIGSGWWMGLGLVESGRPLLWVGNWVEEGGLVGRRMLGLGR